MADGKVEGTVKWFNAAKGFGFINYQGKDHFVHFTSIMMKGYRSLNEGQRVLFNAADSNRGLLAKDVEVLEDAGGVV